MGGAGSGGTLLSKQLNMVRAHGITSFLLDQPFCSSGVTRQTHPQNTTMGTMPKAKSLLAVLVAACAAVAPAGAAYGHLPAGLEVRRVSNTYCTPHEMFSTTVSRHTRGLGSRGAMSCWAVALTTNTARSYVLYSFGLLNRSSSCHDSECISANRPCWMRVLSGWDDFVLLQKTTHVSRSHWLGAFARVVRSFEIFLALCPY